MKIGILIPVYNRLEYFRECIYYLNRAELSQDVAILVADDCSADNEPIIEICQKYHYHYFQMEKNSGIREVIKTGAALLFEACDVIINIDCDVVVKPDFISRMMGAYLYHNKTMMVSGINCTMSDPATGKQRNPLISEYAGYSLKEAVAGQCMLFDKEQYRKWVLPALNIIGNWDHNASINSMKDGKPVAVCTPSVCQHIGLRSSMGHNHQEPDRADDFKFISLPDVTLFGIDSHDIMGIERAAAISRRDIEFGAVKIITDNLFKATQHEARRKEYSKFMLKELTKHFTTSHVLTIHADGYVLNWKAWDKDFLNYDYIGATWSYKDNMNVGNGGFSLRSKKLCDILAKNHIDEDLMHPEDGCICRTFRKSLEDNFGIRFAPEDVANRFSIEAYGAVGFMPPANVYTGQFGFHGRSVDFRGSSIPDYLRYPHVKDHQTARNVQTWDRPRAIR